VALLFRPSGVWYYLKLGHDQFLSPRFQFDALSWAPVQGEAIHHLPHSWIKTKNSELRKARKYDSYKYRKSKVGHFKNILSWEQRRRLVEVWSEVPTEVGTDSDISEDISPPSSGSKMFASCSTFRHWICEATCVSETPGRLPTTRRYNPEDHNFRLIHRWNFLAISPPPLRNNPRDV
jgi:hypothetical protein